MHLARRPWAFFRLTSSTFRAFGPPLRQQQHYPLRAVLLTRAKHSQSQWNRPKVQPFRQVQNKAAESSIAETQTPWKESNEVHFSPNSSQYEQIPEEGDGNYFPKVKVRYLRPFTWALSVSSGIYVFLAYLEAKRELKPAPPASPPDIFQSIRLPGRQQQQQAPPTPTEVATRWWKQLDPMSRLSTGIIVSNGAVHLFGMLAPKYWNQLWHIPALPVNYSLFTSMFVHSGAMHFFFNMWACYNFLPPTGYSRLFEGNLYHTLSFYLSAGLLSGFAQHFSTMFARQKAIVPDIFIRSGGASGALFAVFGAFAMQYPDAGVGIIFLPFSMDAQYFLPLIMTFDFIGMVRGYSFVNFGHAAHLSGALIGAGYSYFDGKTRLWRPLVRFWKKRLQSQS